ncbi:MAG TPA: pseudouridine-5'-phosphate glycosidase [Candidatus Baltobacteraceae bacterium]|nr:pseudouridine-5'-phosphate glycosidase [Candidatus Baltobacteraceae bacterium]
MDAFVTLSPEVRDARERGKPIVALETTILSHGMPYPQNVQTARNVERIVRENGAVPASIALLDGTIHVGLDAAQIEQIGRGNDVFKVSRADLAYALSQKVSGATTVAATMICADLAGIRVFATGGIGGVHRGAEQSMDVSADLHELARTRVCVVCAGAKALLDLPKTLEVLETLGVPVIGYGTSVFPAFWSASSGLPVVQRCDTPQEAAALLRAQETLGLSAGALIAVPIPERYEIPRDEMTVWIDRAISESVEQRVAGKNVTPWLLNRIYELTAGKSLEANIALIENNAAVAAAIAAAL